MNCPLQREETADILLDYSARRLDPSRTAILERHMETCAACAAFRMEQTAVWDALDAWEPGPVSMDFNRRLWQRIDANAPWYRSLIDALRCSNWKPVFPLAAAILLIAGGFVLDHPGVGTAVPAASVQGVSVTVTEANQVEQTLDDLQLLHQLDAMIAPNNDSLKRM